MKFNDSVPSPDEMEIVRFMQKLIALNLRCFRNITGIIAFYLSLQHKHLLFSPLGYCFLY